MTRRTTRPRAYAPDPDAPGRPCDHPDCPAAGEYRAPKSRTSLNQYWWFCLEHVREYNARWDFYKGMSATQIEAQMRSDTGWQRPTWPLGRLGAGFLNEDALRDPLANLGMRPERRPTPASELAPAALRDPLSTLGLALAGVVGRGEDPLQGIGQAPPSGRQRRRPGRGGAVEDHQPRLRRRAEPFVRRAWICQRRVAATARTR